MVVFCVGHRLGCILRMSFPRLGSADAEIKVSSAQYLELSKVLSLKPVAGQNNVLIAKSSVCIISASMVHFTILMYC